MRPIIGSTLQQHDPQTIARAAVDMTGYHPHAELKTNSTDSITLALASNSVWYTLDTWGDTGAQSGVYYLEGDENAGTITMGVKAGGVYLLMYSMSISTDTTALISAGFDVDGAIETRSSRAINLTAAMGYQNISSQVYSILYPTAVVSIRMNSSANSTNLSIRNAGFNMLWIAGDTETTIGGGD